MRIGTILAGGLMFWAQAAFAEYRACVGLNANARPVEVIDACTVALAEDLSARWSLNVFCNMRILCLKVYRIRDLLLENLLENRL